MGSQSPVSRDSNAASAGARILALLNALPPKTKDNLSRLASTWFHRSAPRKAAGKQQSSPLDTVAQGAKNPWVAAGVLGGMALWYLGTRHRDDLRTPHVPGASNGRIRDPDPTMRL